jgi:hypothetical protein
MPDKKQDITATELKEKPLIISPDRGNNPLI